MAGPRGSRKRRPCRSRSLLLGKGPAAPAFASANKSSLWLASQPFISPPGSVLQTKVRGWGGGSSCYSELEGESLPSLSEIGARGFHPPQRTPGQAGLSQVPSVQEPESSPGRGHEHSSEARNPSPDRPWPTIHQGPGLGSNLESGVRQKVRTPALQVTATEPLASIHRLMMGTGGQDQAHGAAAGLQGTGAHMEEPRERVTQSCRYRLAAIPRGQRPSTHSPSPELPRAHVPRQLWEAALPSSPNPCPQGIPSEGGQISTSVSITSGRIKCFEN